MTAVPIRRPRLTNTPEFPSRTAVAFACAAVVTARLVFLWQPLRSDEGGYLLAARNWRAGGEFLYGDYQVDRPPLLMAIFRVAALSEWDRAIRVLAIPFALVVVVAAARAGYLAAGHCGARWSTVVAAALVSSPALAADQADGELFAVAFVAVSVALALDAWHHPVGAAQWWFALGAGAAGAAASLVKQNFLDGLVFVAILVLADAMRARRVTVRGCLVTTGAGIGALLPNLMVVEWARSAGLGGLQMWSELATFRRDAFTVIWEGSTHAPMLRAITLVGLAVVSAMVPLAWNWLRACRTRTSRLAPEQCAVSGGFVFGVAALAAGGSYWPHYLLQLLPMLALAAGMVAARDSPSGARMRQWSRVAAGSAVAAVLVTATVYATVPRVWFQERTGQWLASSSPPGDTAFVAYGAPSILEAADLASPYPYLWSVSMRTLDPGQVRLRATLTAPDAPTWVVQINGFDSWDIDNRGRLRSLVESRYDVAATVCGHQIWLRSNLTRILASFPDC
ncbi:MAG: hypothetical protein M3R09_09150 [Actinomycetota bacterium]|nr:hypothetical protein [Actinomycetota bacterium]